MKPRSTSDPTPITTGLRTPELEEKIRARAYEISSAAGMKDITSMTGCKLKRN